MGVLLGFLAGWAVGARSGSAGYGELADAVRAVRRSEEFTVLAALSRQHLAGALRELSSIVAPPPGTDVTDLRERVLRMTAGRPR